MLVLFLVTAQRVCTQQTYSRSQHAAPASRTDVGRQDMPGLSGGCRRWRGLPIGRQSAPFARVSHKHAPASAPRRGTVSDAQEKPRRSKSKQVQAPHASKHGGALEQTPARSLRSRPTIHAPRAPRPPDTRTRDSRTSRLHGGQDAREPLAHSAPSRSHPNTLALDPVPYIKDSSAVPGAPPRRSFIRRGPQQDLQKRVDEAPPAQQSARATLGAQDRSS